MNREIQQRLQWVKLYKTSGDAGFVCRRCGISRPTLRKWWRRYLAQGIAGLESHSRRTKRSPSTKTGTIGPGLYQYTSVDDYTRYRVLRLYSRRTVANTLDFIDCVIEEMPFPIQRFQTDREENFLPLKCRKD